MWVLCCAEQEVTDVYHYYERRIIDIVRGAGKKVYAWEDINGECGCMCEKPLPHPSQGQSHTPTPYRRPLDSQGGAFSDVPSLHCDDTRLVLLAGWLQALPRTSAPTSTGV